MVKYWTKSVPEMYEAKWVKWGEGGDTDVDWRRLENTEKERHTDTEGETVAESQADGQRQSERGHLMDREKETDWQRRRARDGPVLN